MSNRESEISSQLSQHAKPMGCFILVSSSFLISKSLIFHNTTPLNLKFLMANINSKSRRRDNQLKHNVL